MKLDDVLNTQLKKTGFDIPEGSYPAVLFGYGEPFKLKVAEKFRRPGQPEDRAVMDLRFGIRLPDGKVVEVNRLVSVPTAGGAGSKGNLFKALKAMRGSDPKFFTDKGDFAEGVNLKAFIGSPATVQVTKNDKGFAQVEAVAGPMAGVAVPTLEECKPLAVEGSEDVPF